MQQIEGKTAVITGGASGIGRALAERFATEGMQLALVDVERAALDPVVRDFEARGVPCAGFEVDVADADAMDSLGEAVLERFGTVHVVCNNAGVGAGGKMWELSTADWDFALRPNLWGVIHGVRVFATHLVAQDEGHIVNTASMAGLVSVANMGPYNVSKHAVVTLSETLYHDLQSEGSKVGVSVLCPGHVNTRIWESDRNRNDGAPMSDQVKATREVFRDILADSLSPDAVAGRVHQAILDGTFYIHTHTNHRAAVEQRLQAILDGKRPAQPVQGPEVFSR